MKSVLLIEDDNQLRGMLADFLQKRGWRVLEAADGDEGLGLALNQNPDVVVCDLLVPRTNGFQICSALRREGRRASIVAISGRGYASNRQMALTAGADEFLAKPIHPAELETLLLRLTNGASVTPFPTDPNSGWLRFWGVRGSVPVPGSSTVIYGGNTSCIEVRADDQIIVLDAGTGIRPFGQDLAAEFGERPINVSLLISHTHWDHIQGFPFFLPAYQAKNRIRIYGYEGAQSGFASVFAAQMENPYFPISLKQLPAEISIEELKDLDFELGPIRVRAAFMNHPGICMGFRLNTSQGSVAYLPDNEPFERPADSPCPVPDAMAYARSEYLKMIEFIQGVDVLIIDAQYDAEEYQQHRGWGHGCVDDVVQLALRAEVKRLVLFHHDPSHDDQKVASMTQHAVSLVTRARGKLVVEAAREGLRLPIASQAVGAKDQSKRAIVGG